MLRRHPLRILTLAVMALAMLPAGALAVPPTNDDYLKSIAVNARGTQLTQDQVKDLRDTTEATVQTDLFSPQATGGGPEPVDCKGTPYGATVWYDFHPHANGTTRIATAGYDAVVSVYEFDPASPTLKSRVDCASQAGSTEELFVKVVKGRSYTIQIGGAASGGAPATGMLDLTFEYLSDTDADGVLDPLDKCPKQAGSEAAAGCPPTLHPSVILRAMPTANGIKVRSLLVNAPTGARVKVRCQKGCAITQTRAARAVGFSRLRNIALPAGARLEIFVTKPKSIGSYTRYTITRGNFVRTTRCLKPGSMIPLKKCK